MDGTSDMEEKEGFRGFGTYLAIVHDYIKDGAHSEVNIAFRAKRDIIRYSTYSAYASLDLVSERNRHLERALVGEADSPREIDGDRLFRGCAHAHTIRRRGLPRCSL